MKSIRIWIALGCAFSLLVGSAMAAEKKTEKLTCCQEAAAQGKECRHKCCVAAHKDGKSCTKCNPNKEDLSLQKNSTKAAATAQK
ncbi:MAG TPA: hypothetical protein VNZ64_00200 [Candidatus Acidoferrum sp.]|jgi:hypothetical protein|nr:hypothetical protein [Candidatus Acidoferrum sp.]